MYDIILDSSQLGLQIHESVGHPIELDRVLGMEANFAGTSFLTLDKLRALRYGSDLVNVVADARQEHGPVWALLDSTTKACPRSALPLSRNGLFTGYLSSRETAHTIGLDRSGGTLRAESWNRLPMIRMTNISILPGEKPLTLEQLIADTDHGIYIETNKSWSIDDKRYNFQFGCEIGWEIKNGKRSRMLKNPILFRHHDGLLEFDGCNLLARSMDVMGHAELREGTAAAGHGNRSRRGPREVSACEGRFGLSRQLIAHSLRGTEKAKVEC